jgi:hypothetical protein
MVCVDFIRISMGSIAHEFCDGGYLYPQSLEVERAMTPINLDEIERDAWSTTPNTVRALVARIRELEAAK